jgi:pyruvate/2-oxoglutarate dehydrogenase complex dihydrolipoamide dehydrogenase (E3) component
MKEVACRLFVIGAGPGGYVCAIRAGQLGIDTVMLAAEDGFVRVVARADNLVLGIQAAGAGVSELAAAFALALETGLRLEDIAGTIHTHPTQGEAFQEGALKALSHATVLILCSPASTRMPRGGRAHARTSRRGATAPQRGRDRLEDAI